MLKSKKSAFAPRRAARPVGILGQGWMIRVLPLMRTVTVALASGLELGVTVVVETAEPPERLRSPSGNGRWRYRILSS